MFHVNLWTLCFVSDKLKYQALERILFEEIRFWIIFHPPKCLHLMSNSCVNRFSDEGGLVFARGCAVDRYADNGVVLTKIC